MYCSVQGSMGGTRLAQTPFGPSMSRRWGELHFAQQQSTGPARTALTFPHSPNSARTGPEWAQDCAKTKGTGLIRASLGHGPV